MAITTLTPTRLGVGRETIVQIVSGVNITTGHNLKATFDASVSGNIISSTAKNVTFAPPETAHELQSFLGTDTNSFQNQLLEEKPPGVATFTATLVLGEDEILEPWLDKSHEAITGSYTRYQLGNSQTKLASLLVNVSGTGGQINIALVSAAITKWGDVRISGPDSHWEQDIQATCLAKNFYWEYKD